MEGKTIEGVMDASDDGVVSLKLQEMGLLPVRIGSASRKTVLSREIEWPWKRKKVRHKDLLIFTQELHTLVHAGFPLDRSLAVLSQLAESPAMSEVIQDVLKEVKGGKSFSEALSKFPRTFSPLYINMVKASELSGTFGHMLERIVEYLNAQLETRQMVVGAMV